MLLKKNSAGPEVLTLSELLRDRGFLDQVSTEFDLEIEKAVIEFQARHLDSRGRPLVVDGVVGPLTWWALRNPEMPSEHMETGRAPGAALPPGGSAAGRAALAAAMGEMNAGACEMGANNSGRWVEKYLNGLAPTPANWCAGFVSWCYEHADGGIPFRYSVGARDIRNQFKRRDWVYDPNTTAPEPGDIIVWWRGRPDGWMGHIGLVHRFENGIVHTVEGNKGGFPAPVRMFDYVLGRIDRLLGFGRVQ